MSRELRVDYLPLSEVRRWPRNAKEHDAGAIHQSVERFGFVNPIIVNETTGYLLAGHGRIDTLQQRKAGGSAAPDGIREQNGEWLVPVIRGIELPEHEAEAYAIADNRTTELGGWNSDLLAAVLADQAAAGTLEGTGYDGDDLDELLRELELPDPQPQGEPELKSECLVEIRCTSAALDIIEPTLNEWAQQNGTTIDISR